MATNTRVIISCSICVVACLLSVACFVAGFLFSFYENDIGIVLLGLAVDLAPITSFLKKFSEDLDTSSTTQEFYYIAILYTCIVITLGQMTVGIWFCVYDSLRDQGIQLIFNAVLLTVFTVYLKRTDAPATAPSAREAEKKEDLKITVLPSPSGDEKEV